MHYDRAEEEECLGWADPMLSNLWADLEEWGGGCPLCVGDGSSGENRQVTKAVYIVFHVGISANLRWYSNVRHGTLLSVV